MKPLPAKVPTTTATALLAASVNDSTAKAARFALNARKLAEGNRIPAEHANKLYGAKK